MGRSRVFLDFEVHALDGLQVPTKPWVLNLSAAASKIS